MKLIYHIYGSAKIGMLNSNQALLEVFSGELRLSTFHGFFVFSKEDLIQIYQRKFLFGLFKSVKIRHQKQGYNKQIFFHIPPFTGENFSLLKQALVQAGLPVK